MNPARVGDNLLRVQVNAPADGLSGLVVEFIPPPNSGQGTISQPIPLTGAGVAVSAPDHLPLNVAGAWTMEVSATTANGTTSASKTIRVATADGQQVTPTIAPTPTEPPITAAPAASTTIPG